MDFAVAFVRHGQYAQPPNVPSAHLPHPLVAEGRGQSVAGCDTLWAEARAHRWQLCPVIDASPLLRAWETATLFAESLRERGATGTTVETFDALTERSLGAAANLTLDEIAAVIDRDPRHAALPPGWKRTTDFRLPFVGAESLRDAGDRVAAHVRQRAETTACPPGDGLFVKVIVGHGGSLRHAAAQLGMLDPPSVHRLSMFHAAPIVHAYQQGQWRHVFGAWKQRSAAALDNH